MTSIRERLPGLWRTAPEQGRPRRAGYALVVIGSLAALAWVVVAVAAPEIATHDPLRTDPANRLLPPSGTNYFGTDSFGRDVFARTVVGSRVSLVVGAGTAVVAAVAGTLLGCLAGFYRFLDSVIMRFTDGLMAFPAVLFAIALVAVLGQGIVQVVIALSVVFTPLVIRVAYGEARALSRLEFVDAARGFGAAGPWVIARHLVPNMLPPLIVQMSYVFAVAVLSEAGLSFVGAGVPPPDPSWGRMASEGRGFLYSAWWLVVAPGAAITSLVLALNVLGDGLRDMLDTRLREEVRW